jgi:acylphosphatase
MDVVAREVTVRGRVQGVFFRDSCRQQAERLGVTGWVRNEPDGTVRAHLEGEESSVAQLVDWCGEGPRHASVESVDVSPAEPAGHARFEAR